MERIDIKKALIADLEFLRRHEGATKNNIAKTLLVRFLADRPDRLRIILNKLPIDRSYMRCLTNALGLTNVRHASSHLYMRRQWSQETLGVSQTTHRRLEKSAISSATTILTAKFCEDPALLAKADDALSSPWLLVKEAEKILARANADLVKVAEILGSIK